MESKRIEKRIIRLNLPSEKGKSEIYYTITSQLQYGE